MMLDLTTVEKNIVVCAFIIAFITLITAIIFLSKKKYKHFDYKLVIIILAYLSALCLSSFSLVIWVAMLFGFFLR